MGVTACTRYGWCIERPAARERKYPCHLVARRGASACPCCWRSSGPPAWKTIPSWAVIGTADQVIPPAELTVMAKRAGVRITDVNAGHLSLISDPSAVTRVILQAVQATGCPASRPGVPRIQPSLTLRIPLLSASRS